MRRLSAEELRDSMLAVGGAIDLSMGGSLLHVKNREYFFDHTSKDGTKYDSPRRSLYLPVVRNNLYDVFQLFDYADASVLNGNRDSTTVAPQALFLLNSDLSLRASESLARRVAETTADDQGRVRALYVVAFGRPASESEVARAVKFLELEAGASGGAGDGGREKAWRLLCQTVLASNEFAYVR